MTRFFLTIIGVDEYLLSSTKWEKRTGFVIAGIITTLLLPISFLSSVYLMSYLIKDIILDALIALLFSTIVFNFYRFTISSIIWRSPDWEKPSEVIPPNFSSTFIKIITCS